MCGCAPENSSSQGGARRDMLTTVLPVLSVRARWEVRCACAWCPLFQTTASPGEPVLTARFKHENDKRRFCVCEGDGAGRGGQPAPPCHSRFAGAAYSWVSVKVVCSLVTELKPLMASIRSSSSRHWKGSHRVRLAVPARPPGPTPCAPHLNLQLTEASRHSPSELHAKPTCASWTLSLCQTFIFLISKP